MSAEIEKAKLRTLQDELEMDKEELDENINDIIQCILDNNPQISMKNAKRLCEATGTQIEIRELELYERIRNSPVSEEFLTDEC